MSPSLASLEDRRAARRYENYRIYARSAALCFELDQLAATRPDEVLRTISVEGAGALASPPEPKNTTGPTSAAFR